METQRKAAAEGQGEGPEEKPRLLTCDLGCPASERGKEASVV